MKLKTLLRAAFLAAVLTVLCVVTASASYIGVGTVNSSSGLRLREIASTDGKILTTAVAGARVMVTSESKNGWYQVEYEGETGYMLGEYLDVDTEFHRSLGYGEVVIEGGGSLCLRKGPSTDDKKLASIPSGSLVELDGFENGWFQVTYNGKEGYASAEYIVLTDKRPARQSSSQKSSTATVPDPPVPTTAVPADVSGSELGQKIVALAYQYLGYPYVYGTAGPNSFDCSGLTSYILKQLGYSISRSASSQWYNTPGQRIYSMSEMEPGDLFFINNPAYGRGKAVSHVGIYIGGGQILHASSPSTGVIITDMNVSWMGPYFVGAIRMG